MSNFCSSAFDDREWSRKPSGGSQRRFEPSRHARRPPLSSMMNPVPRQGGHSYQTEGKEGGRDGVGHWGRQQFNRPSAGPGANGRRNLGGGHGQAVEPTAAQVSTHSRTAIKDLYPHQPNTVSSIYISSYSVCGLCIS